MERKSKKGKEIRERKRLERNLDRGEPDKVAERKKMGGEKNPEGKGRGGKEGQTKNSLKTSHLR